MRTQEAHIDMVSMRQPIRQFSAHPDPRDEIIQDLAKALEDFDNWFSTFNPEDRADRMAGRRVVIRAREILAKVRA